MCPLLYTNTNIDKFKEYKFEYYKQNYDKIKKQNSEYYKQKSEQSLEEIKAYIEQNSEIFNYNPNKEIYGIIYLVYNNKSQRYYVGQTINGVVDSIVHVCEQYLTVCARNSTFLFFLIF